MVEVTIEMIDLDLTCFYVWNSYTFLADLAEATTRAMRSEGGGVVGTVNVICVQCSCSHHWDRWPHMWHINVHTPPYSLSIFGIIYPIGRGSLFWHIFGSNMWSIFGSWLCLSIHMQNCWVSIPREHHCCVIYICNVAAKFLGDICYLMPVIHVKYIAYMYDLRDKFVSGKIIFKEYVEVGWGFVTYMETCWVFMALQHEDSLIYISMW